MRLAFMGTPAFAVPALDALAAAGHTIAAVYTQPPRPAARGGAVTRSAVHRRAEALGLPIRTPVNFRDEGDRAAFAALDLDAAVVAAYGLILPAAILAAPRRGCINLHASLLPRWRGAAPIQRAILAGDAETGVTIMAMERGLDTGPMLLAAAVPIGHATAGELTATLADLGARLIVDALSRLDELVPVAQPDDGVTYAAKVDKAEARLDFTRPAVEVERAVRAFNPAPGAFAEIGGERIKLHAAEVVAGDGQPGAVLDARLTIACGTGAIRPTLVQRAGETGYGDGGAAQRLADPRRHPVVTRFRLTLEYDGAPFMGWQRQGHGPSVQAAVEAAVTATTGEAATVTGCGRTDAGVHARGQVAHVDIARAMTPFRLMEAVNAHLRPDPIAVVECSEAAPDFHARFDCIGREYRYHIVNRRAPLVLDRGRAWQVGVPLDADAMAAAATALLGRHDFTTFRSVRCQARSPVKTLDRLDVGRIGDVIVVDVAARSFLHHQVRSMVGCLRLVGEGKWSAETLAAALAARDRTALGMNAPADGLTFVAAHYGKVSAGLTHG